MVTLAYDWLGNLAHEIIGTAMFALVIVHNTFNKRWYTRVVSKREHDPRDWINLASILALGASAFLLLCTSLMISRSVFSFLNLGSGYSTRQLHGVAACWMLVIVAIHVRIRWQMIMSAISGWLGISEGNNIRTAILRMATAAAVADGIHSWFVLGIGSRLMAEATMQFWDFDRSTVGFFIHLASIAALYICASHYSMRVVARFRSAVSKG